MAAGACGAAGVAAVGSSFVGLAAGLSISARALATELGKAGDGSVFVAGLLSAVLVSEALVSAPLSVDLLFSAVFDDLDSDDLDSADLLLLASLLAVLLDLRAWRRLWRERCLLYLFRATGLPSATGCALFAVVCICPVDSWARNGDQRQLTMPAATINAAHALALILMAVSPFDIFQQGEKLLPCRHDGKIREFFVKHGKTGAKATRAGCDTHGPAACAGRG